MIVRKYGRINTEQEKAEKFVVLGIGINGCEAVNRMIEHKTEGVEFAIAAEDEQVLDSCMAAKKFSVNAIHDFKKFFDYNFHDTDMIFIVDISGSCEAEKNFALNTAYAAKSSGALTLGVPSRNTFMSEDDMQRFKDYSDAVFVNDDEEVCTLIEGIVNMIMESGFVNIDFLDLKRILFNTGTAYFAAGNVKDMNIPKNAKKVLMNITAGADVTLSDMADTAKIIGDFIDPSAQVMWGHTVDENMNEEMIATVICGMNDNGYIDYPDMLEKESRENLEAIARNGLNDVQILRLGSHDKFFSKALVHGTSELIRSIINHGHDPKTLERNGVFPNDILANVAGRKDAAEILRILFSKGINADKNNLYMFLTAKSTEVYKLLIDYGFNVNAKDEHGFTPLLFAVMRLSYEHAEILIDAGADVNARSNIGMIPLMSVKAPDVAEKIIILINNGADVNAKDDDGKNTLMHLSRIAYSRPGIVRLFADAGIDLNAEDKNGKTALDHMFKALQDTCRNFYNHILPFMMKAGVKQAQNSGD